MRGHGVIRQLSGQYRNNSQQSDESNQDAIGETRPENPRIPSAIKTALHIIPLLNAGNDAAQTAIGLANKSAGIAYSCTAFSFSSSFIIGSQYTIDGLNEAYSFLKKRQIPDNWERISKTRHGIAIGLSLTLLTLITLSDAIQSYFFVQSVPDAYNFRNRIDPRGWIALASLITFSILINTIFGEGFQNYKYIYEKMGTRKFEYSNKFSRIATPIIATPLSAISGVSDAVSTFVGVSSVFKINSKNVLYGLLAPSALTGVSDGFLNQDYYTKCLDALFGTLGERFPTKKEVAYASLSLMAAGFMGYASPGLYEFLYENFTQTLFDQSISDLPEVAQQALSYYFWISGGQDAISSGFGMFQIIQMTEKKMQKLYSYCAGANRTYSYERISNEEPASSPSPAILEAGTNTATNTAVFDSDDEHPQPSAPIAIPPRGPLDEVIIRRSVNADSPESRYQSAASSMLFTPASLSASNSARRSNLRLRSTRSDSEGENNNPYLGIAKLFSTSVANPPLMQELQDPAASEKPNAPK